MVKYLGEFHNPVIKPLALEGGIYGRYHGKHYKPQYFFLCYLVVRAVYQNTTVWLLIIANLWVASRYIFTLKMSPKNLCLLVFTSLFPPTMNRADMCNH